jgi:DNA-binding LacI/PurR family transcriptional regulator
MARSGRVTSRDVAAEAGVSRATVSYVLNDVEDQRISDETRARVRDVAKRLGYAPDPAAQALRDGSTDLVLIANPPWRLGPLVAGGVTAASERLEERGYVPLLAIGHAANRERLVRACQRAHPRGIIGPGAELKPAAVRLIRASGTHAILALDRKPGRHIPTLVVDQGVFGRLAIEYLLEREHRRVLAVAPDSPQSERVVADDRLEGAHAAAGAGGMRLDEARVESEASLPVKIADAFEVKRPPTAIYAFNDEYAMAAISALLDLGLKVPDDVAVIGGDDIPPAALFRPALTTLRIDAVSIYTAAAEALIKLMQGGKPTLPTMADMARVIVRESA